MRKATKAEYDTAVSNAIHMKTIYRGDSQYHHLYVFSFGIEVARKHEYAPSPRSNGIGTPTEITYRVNPEYL